MTDDVDRHRAIRSAAPNFDPHGRPILEERGSHTFAEAVRASFLPTVVPCAPFLRYYAPHPRSRLSRLTEEFGGATPYWAYLWPGGAALIQYVIEHPEAVAGKRVLDFGAGSGLVGIAATKMGAATVCACDVDPLARAMCRANSELNDVRLEFAEKTSLSEPNCVDVVLAGDVFYDPEVARATLKSLTDLQGPNRIVLIGDIGRPHLPLGDLRRITDYPATDVGHSRERQVERAAVYCLER